MAQGLFEGGTRVVVPLVIPIRHRSIWQRGPHQLWHGFGQHMPVLLAFFDSLFGLFLLIDIGAGPNPVEDRALRIALRHTSDQKPAIGSAAAVLHAMLHFLRHARLDGGLPHVPDSGPIIRMHPCHPANSFGLFMGHRQKVDQALIVVGDRPIRSCDPDKLWGMASTNVRSSSSACLRSVISRPAQIKYSICWLASRWEVIVINTSRDRSARGWILASKRTVSPWLARARAARKGSWVAGSEDHAGSSVSSVPTTSSRRRWASARGR